MSSFGMRSGVRPGQTTSKLLEKVSKQLKGGYGGRDYGSNNVEGSEEDEGDGISSYLRLLSEKTSQQLEKSQTDRNGESSDEELDVKAANKKIPASAGANRYLKKSSSTPAPVAEAKSTTSQAQPLGGRANKKSDKSPTLHRVEAFTKKYNARKNGPIQMSDSDVELNLSMDEDVLADVKAVKKNHPASSSDSSVPPRSSGKTISKTGLKASKGSDDEDSSSMKIGKSGNKFLKKTVAISDTKDTEKLSPARGTVKSPVKDTQHPSLHRSGRNELRSTEVILDSDEESLAEYIGALSSGNSGQKVPSKVKSKESVRSDFKARKSQLNSDLSDRSSGEMESDNFEMNVRDIESLEEMKPVADVESSSVYGRTNTQEVNSQGQKVQKRDKRFRNQKEVWKDQTEDVFSQLGLQSVEELLENVKDDEIEPLPLSELLYESDFDVVPSTSRGISPMPLRSILSPTPRSMTPKSSRSRVRLMDELTEIRSRSPSPETPKSASRRSAVTKSETIHTATDSDNEMDRTMQTITKENSSGGSDSEENSTIKTVSDASSISSFDRMSVTRRSRRRIQRHSSSSRRSSTASERYYSDDFSNASPTSESQSTSRRSSYSDDQTSQTSTTDSTKSREKSKYITKNLAKKVGTKDTEVQTGLDVGLHFHWVQGLAQDAWIDTQYRQAFVEPAAVATTVVNADALNALTNFSPATLALNDLLHQQLHLTNHLMSIHRRLHNNLIHSLDSSAYKYTTLKDTKEFIRKHTKPVMSFEEALLQVKEEMGLTY